MKMSFFGLVIEKLLAKIRFFVYKIVVYNRIVNFELKLYLHQINFFLHSATDSDDSEIQTVFRRA